MLLRLLATCPDQSTLGSLFSVQSTQEGVSKSVHELWDIESSIAAAKDADRLDLLPAAFLDSENVDAATASSRSIKARVSRRPGSDIRSESWLRLARHSNMASRRQWGAVQRSRLVSFIRTASQLARSAELSRLGHLQGNETKGGDDSHSDRNPAGTVPSAPSPLLPGDSSTLGQRPITGRSAGVRQFATHASANASSLRAIAAEAASLQEGLKQRSYTPRCGDVQSLLWDASSLWNFGSLGQRLLALQAARVAHHTLAAALPRNLALSVLKDATVHISSTIPRRIIAAVASIVLAAQANAPDTQWPHEALALGNENPMGLAAIAVAQLIANDALEANSTAAEWPARDPHIDGYRPGDLSIDAVDAAIALSDACTDKLDQELGGSRCMAAAARCTAMPALGPAAALLRAFVPRLRVTPPLGLPHGIPVWCPLVRRAIEAAASLPGWDSPHLADRQQPVALEPLFAALAERGCKTNPVLVSLAIAASTSRLAARMARFHPREMSNRLLTSMHLVARLHSLSNINTSVSLAPHRATSHPVPEPSFERLDDRLEADPQESWPLCPLASASRNRVALSREQKLFLGHVARCDTRALADLPGLPSSTPTAAPARVLLTASNDQRALAAAEPPRSVPERRHRPLCAAASLVAEWRSRAMAESDGAVLSRRWSSSGALAEQPMLMSGAALLMYDGAAGAWMPHERLDTLSPSRLAPATDVSSPPIGTSTALWEWARAAEGVARDPESLAAAVRSAECHFAAAAAASIAGDRASRKAVEHSSAGGPGGSAAAGSVPTVLEETTPSAAGSASRLWWISYARSVAAASRLAMFVHEALAANDTSVSESSLLSLVPATVTFALEAASNAVSPFAGGLPELVSELALLRISSSQKTTVRAARAVSTAVIHAALLPREAPYPNPITDYRHQLAMALGHAAAVYRASVSSQASGPAWLVASRWAAPLRDQRFLEPSWALLDAASDPLQALLAAALPAGRSLAAWRARSEEQDHGDFAVPVASVSLWAVQARAAMAAFAVLQQDASAAFASAATALNAAAVTPLQNDTLSASRLNAAASALWAAAKQAAKTAQLLASVQRHAPGPLTRAGENIIVFAAAISRTNHSSGGSLARSALKHARQCARALKALAATLADQVTAASRVKDAPGVDDIMELSRRIRLAPLVHREPPDNLQPRAFNFTWMNDAASLHAILPALPLVQPPLCATPHVASTRLGGSDSLRLSSGIDTTRLADSVARTADVLGRANESGDISAATAAASVAATVASHAASLLATNTWCSLRTNTDGATPCLSLLQLNDFCPAPVVSDPVCRFATASGNPPQSHGGGDDSNLPRADDEAAIWVSSLRDAAAGKSGSRDVQNRACAASSLAWMCGAAGSPARGPQAEVHEARLLGVSPLRGLLESMSREAGASRGATAAVVPGQPPAPPTSGPSAFSVSWTLQRVNSLRSAHAAAMQSDDVAHRILISVLSPTGPAATRLPVNSNPNTHPIATRWRELVPQLLNASLAAPASAAADWSANNLDAMLQSCCGASTSSASEELRSCSDVAKLDVAIAWAERAQSRLVAMAPSSKNTARWAELRHGRLTGDAAWLRLQRAALLHPWQAALPPGNQSAVGSVAHLRALESRRLGKVVTMGGDASLLLPALEAAIVADAASNASGCADDRDSCLSGADGVIATAVAPFSMLQAVLPQTLADAFQPALPGTPPGITLAAETMPVASASSAAEAAELLSSASRAGAGAAAMIVACAAEEVGGPMTRGRLPQFGPAGSARASASSTASAWLRDPGMLATLRLHRHALVLVAAGDRSAAARSWAAAADLLLRSGGVSQRRLRANLSEGVVTIEEVVPACDATPPDKAVCAQQQAAVFRMGAIAMSLLSDATIAVAAYGPLLSDVVSVPAVVSASLDRGFSLQSPTSGAALSLPASLVEQIGQALGTAVCASKQSPSPKLLSVDLVLRRLALHPLAILLHLAHQATSAAASTASAASSLRALIPVAASSGQTVGSAASSRAQAEAIVQSRLPAALGAAGWLAVARVAAEAGDRHGVSHALARAAAEPSVVAATPLVAKIALAGVALAAGRPTAALKILDTVALQLFQEPRGLVNPVALTTALNSSLVRLRGGADADDLPAKLQPAVVNERCRVALQSAFLLAATRSLSAATASGSSVQRRQLIPQRLYSLLQRILPPRSAPLQPRIDQSAAAAAAHALSFIVQAPLAAPIPSANEQHRRPGLSGIDVSRGRRLSPVALAESAELLLRGRGVGLGWGWWRSDASDSVELSPRRPVAVVPDAAQPAWSPLFRSVALSSPSAFAALDAEPDAAALTARLLTPPPSVAAIRVATERLGVAILGAAAGLDSGHVAQAAKGESLTAGAWEVARRHLALAAVRLELVREEADEAASVLRSGSGSEFQGGGEGSMAVRAVALRDAASLLGVLDGESASGERGSTLCGCIPGSGRSGLAAGVLAARQLGRALALRPDPDAGTDHGCLLLPKGSAPGTLTGRFALCSAAELLHAHERAGIDGALLRAVQTLAAALVPVTAVSDAVSLTPHNSDSDAALASDLPGPGDARNAALSAVPAISTQTDSSGTSTIGIEEEARSAVVACLESASALPDAVLPLPALLARHVAAPPAEVRVLMRLGWMSLSRGDAATAEESFRRLQRHPLVSAGRSEWVTALSKLGAAAAVQQPTYEAQHRILSLAGDLVRSLGGSLTIPQGAAAASPAVSATAAAAEYYDSAVLHEQDELTPSPVDSHTDPIAEIRPRRAQGQPAPSKPVSDDLSDRAASQFAGAWSIGATLPPSERRSLLAQVAAALHSLGFSKAVKALLSGRASITLSEGTLPAALGESGHTQRGGIQFASGGFASTNAKP